MDQKINTKAGVIIILIVAFTAGLFVVEYRKGQKIDEVQMQNAVINKKEVREITTEQKINDKNAKCPESGIDEFGAISRDEDMIIYETNCILAYDDHKRATKLYNYYARDAKGKFNRKIFTVLNTPDFGGGTFASIVDPHLDTVVIHRTGANKEVSFINILGEKVDNFLYDENDLKTKKQISPNGKYLATAATQYWIVEPRSDASYIKIKNLKNNTVKEYETGRTTLLSGWSSDSKKLYISGGIYEFSAPAYLEEINVENEKVRKYENLDNLFYPVNVFPEDGMAFVTDKNNWPGQEQQKVSLYKIDLDSGKIKKIANEFSQNTFRNIIKIKGYILYENLTNDEKFEVKKMNIANGDVNTIFENSEVLAHSETKLVLKRGREYLIYDIDKNKEQLIGKDFEAGKLMNTEFINKIVGFVYAKS